MSSPTRPDIREVIGSIPYRMAFAGGWIDQPFVSALNPKPPGSMVVVGIEPTCMFMERAGMATGTRKVARRLWGDRLPDGDPATLVRELYAEENRGKPDPSGSQDMIGLIYPGINRLDFDRGHEDGIFPCHIESCQEASVARWLESVVHMVPIAPRPAGYSPLGVKNLSAEWVQRLGESGKQCYQAIVERDLDGLADSMNQCMECWATLLPHVVEHPTIETDLWGILSYYQRRYPGAMYSGCGGGYLYVVSEEIVPGGFRVQVRTDESM